MQTVKPHARYFRTFGLYVVAAKGKAVSHHSLDGALRKFYAEWLDRQLRPMVK